MPNIEAMAIAAAAIGIEFALVRAPRFAARLAFLPLGRAVTVVLPPALRSALRQRAAEGASYRSMPEASLAVSSLPGLKGVERDRCLIWFFPDLGYAAVRPRWPTVGPGRAATIVRVDVEPDGSTLVLRARQFPMASIWITAIAIVLTLWALRPISLLILAAALFGLIGGERSAANDCRRAAIAELQERIESLGEEVGRS
jgi:hypothetical protein